MLHFKSAILTLVLTIALITGLSNTATAQVRVNVSGTEYDITANPGSFNTVQGLPGIDLTNTATAPWYTGSTSTALPISFANAWQAAATGSSIPSGSIIWFAYFLNGGNVSVLGWLNNGGSYFFLSHTPTIAETILGANPYYYATAVPVILNVPEINGSALAQMLLVLGVGYLMIRARRRVS